MNKEGIGQILSTSVVLIFVFVVMVVFFIISGFLGGLRGADDVGEINSVSFDEETVVFEGLDLALDDSRKSLLVFELLIRFYRDEISISEFDKAISGIVGSKNNCLVLVHSERELFELDDLYRPDVYERSFEYLDNGEVVMGNVGNLDSNFFIYRDAGLIKDVSFSDSQTGKRIFVKSYFGRCLDE